MAGSNRVLVVFVDAFGPAQLDRFSDYVDFLPNRKSLGGILGYSSGALPSILTGTTPAIHGRMCLFSERESGKASILRPLKWLGLLPRLVHERGRVRQIAEKLLTKAAGLEGYVALHKVPPELFEWLDMPEREDMFQVDRIGGASTFLADARSAGLEVYAAPWQMPEPERWTHTHQVLDKTPPDLAFLYCAELDGIMHREGPQGHSAEPAFERIATNIQRARETLASDGSRVTTLVVGDHGMSKVDVFIDPRNLVTRVSDLRLFVDSTMLRVWGTESQLSRVRLEIEREGWDGLWLEADDLASRNVPKNHVFGKAMFVLPEGAIFAPSFLGGRVSGMHGYDIHSACAQAALASDAPIPEDITTISDVARVVRSQLGLI
jgi:hypothetical protein